MVTAEVSMSRCASLLFLLATLATACGGSDEVDLSGVDSVDAHLADPEACEDAPPRSTATTSGSRRGTISAHS